MLKGLSNGSLKILAASALIGLGAATAGSVPARADTFRTNCVGDNCIRLRCNDWGDECFQVGYFPRYSEEYGPYRTRYVCDEDGDYCHTERMPVYDSDEW